MAIPITLVQRANPRDRKQPNRFFARPLVVDEMSFDELTEELARICRMRPLDVKRLLRALAEVVQQEVQLGKIVRLGDLGSMRLQISSDGCAKEEDFDPSQIRRKAIQFNVGKRIRRELEAAEVWFID